MSFFFNVLPGLPAEFLQKLFLFIFLTSLLLMAGCSSKPYAVRLPEDARQSGKNTIYVVSHGWHTGLVLPAEKVQVRMPELKERFGNTEFIEFGWGDKGFYQANEITTGLTLRAMFWSSGSVIHTVAVQGNVMNFFPNSEVSQICLSDVGVSSLIEFISGSFSRNQQGGIIRLKNGIYGDSQFYEGVGDYYMFNTCNKWTAKGLQSAGLNISPTFMLTAGSVMSSLHDHVSSCTRQVFNSDTPLRCVPDGM